MSVFLTLVIGILVLLVFLFVTISFLFFLIDTFLGLPFVPLKKEKADQMFKLAAIKRWEKVYDLGSGDGRLVIEAAKLGANAFGIEINPFLVWLSRFKIKKANLKSEAKIIHGNFWKINLADADVILVYGIKKIMNKLEKKLKKELKKGARVITVEASFPYWQPDQKLRSAFLYKKIN